MGLGRRGIAPDSLRARVATFSWPAPLLLVVQTLKGKNLERRAPMPPVVSEWNPTGSDTNCMACAARYLHYQILGRPVDEEKSKVLEIMSEPETAQGFVPSLERQMRNAIIRLQTIMESVGLREYDRHEAYVGKYNYPAGHYAVLGLYTAHVIYGEVEQDGAGFATLFCPQTNQPYSLARLGGNILAIRFLAK
jgi:hypothetical protein